MSKKIKLTEEQIVAIEKYLREDGTVRGAAREVLGKESRESTIRAGISNGHILGDGFASEEVLVIDQLVEMIRLHDQDNVSFKNLSKMFGISRPAVKRFFSKKTYKEFWESYNEKGIAAGETKDPTHKRKILSGKKYVITSAQNNTFVHDKFLKSLLQYCDKNNAELLVSTFHYNKNGFQNGSDKEIWFDPKIREYIIDESCLIGKDLVFSAELNILPTAVNPLSGLQNYTNKLSAIVPHTKLQLESLPTPKNEPAKLMHTTGTVTQRNYVQMKAGQKAEHNHVFGALVVEVDKDDDWFVRQLVAESDTGCFYDLDKYYTPKGCIQDLPVEAINWGDIHAAKLDTLVAEASWGDSEGSMVSCLRPKYLFLHDIFDHKFRNHHSIKDPYFLFKMFVDGTESVESEVLLTTKVIESMIDKCEEVVVVSSNHDLALERWLKEQNYKTDPVNALFFLQMQYLNYKSMEQGVELETFKTACNLVNPKTEDVTFLKEDESFVICEDIECGQHSHLGNNGGRGSVRAFQMQGGRFNIGHSHSANIKDGVYQAGVSGKMDMGYNKGGSSWSHSHIVTYKNGKRCIVTLKDGKWRA